MGNSIDLTAARQLYLNLPTLHPAIRTSVARLHTWPVHAPELVAVVDHGAVAPGFYIEDLPAVLALVETKFQLGGDAVRLHDPGAHPDIIAALSARCEIADRLVGVAGQFLRQCCHEGLGNLLLHAGTLLGRHAPPCGSGSPAGHVVKVKVGRDFCFQKGSGLFGVLCTAIADEGGQLVDAGLDDSGRCRRRCLRCLIVR